MQLVLGCGDAYIAIGSSRWYFPHRESVIFGELRLHATLNGYHIG